MLLRSKSMMILSSSLLTDEKYWTRNPLSELFYFARWCLCLLVGSKIFCNWYSSLAFYSSLKISSIDERVVLNELRVQDIHLSVFDGPHLFLRHDADLFGWFSLERWLKGRKTECFSFFVRPSYVNKWERTTVGFWWWRQRSREKSKSHLFFDQTKFCGRVHVRISRTTNLLAPLAGLSSKTLEPAFKILSS